MRPLYTDDELTDSSKILGVSINLASPETILSWSHGEVTSPNTIQYKTQKPEKGGLFCQKIFGPVKDFECACGLYKSNKAEGRICEKCGVLVTSSAVRRTRMGHIALAAPVAHCWYSRGQSKVLAKVVGIKQKDLEDILSYQKYIVIDPGDTELSPLQILNETEFNNMYEKYEEDFKAGKGAGALKEILEKMDVQKECKELLNKISTCNSQQTKKNLYARYFVLKKFADSKTRPEWMILTVLPVIPADLRPMAQMDGGNFAISDINELYKRVIARNNRLKDMIEKCAPSIIIDAECRMLQQAVDCLFDNKHLAQNARATTGNNKRELKSLTDSISGKTGRFRQNLLGKRVDYSGRSVICVEPKLKIWQCGLPKPLALELYNPFVCRKLMSQDSNLSARAARRMVERQDPRVWDALESVIDGHPVFLNRAPTLHRLGIQAFQPVLVEGNAIKLNPLVCAAFNADFDGDQMAVHLPISPEAQAEARFLMLSATNLLKPSDGKPVATPSQDMVLGAYYLTMEKDGEKGEGKIFRDMAEAEMAYANHDITLLSKIKVRMTSKDGKRSKLIDCSLGKLIFNSIIPQDLGYVDRSDPEHELDLEINFHVKKKELGKIAEECIRKHDMATASEVLDNMKSLGYKYSTIAGFTVSAFDATIPENKQAIIDKAEATVARMNNLYQRGFMSNEERSKRFCEAWNNATDEITEALEQNYDLINNPIHMMSDSGARGSVSQLRQLAGFRGLIANTSGNTIEMPIRSNYREGLNVLEYFISSRGARKGLADTALRTADSGYMTRRLVDVAQSAVIKEYDCGCHKGIKVRTIIDDSSSSIIEELEERLIGRFLVDNLTLPDGTVIDTDTLITKELAKKICNAGIEEVTIRSSLTCETENGICSKCYGLNLGDNRVAQVGDAVGVISAQSIGEPGTQLTMRTFHTGGVAKGGQDITQGLPRVEEVFEDRAPKVMAILAEIDGTVSIEHEGRGTKLVIKNATTEEVKSYPISYDMRVLVSDGEEVTKGTKLTFGSIKPSDMLRVCGADAAREYIITEIQKPYRQQGVDINDKHIEVIMRYMMNRVRITKAGSTRFTEGEAYERERVLRAERRIAERIANGEKLIQVEYEPTLLGLTKAAVKCDSFLSAASFQESKRVLSEAAISGKIDHLTGLKENIMMGRLMPAGTGLPVYTNIELRKAEDVSEKAE